MKRAQSTANTAASGIAKSAGAIKAGLIGLVGGLSVSRFLDVAKSALEYAGSLAEVAQQLGVTAKDLQVFRFAAGQVGVSQDQLETGLSKLTITLGKVAAGAKEPAKALNAIGVSVDQIKGKDTGDAFRIIADGLQKVTDRSQRAAVEVALFGKTGSKLDNLLSGGSEALSQLTDAAEKLGIVLSDEQIRQADETADKLDALKTVLSARIAGVVADNAQSIIGFADSLVYLVGKVGDALDALSRLRAFFAEAEQLYSLPALAKRAVGVPVNATGLGQFAQNGGSVTLKLPPARPVKPKFSPSSIDQFLAPGGGKPKKAAVDHSAEDALRDQNEFGQQLRRAHIDTLRAQQDLARDYIERTSISVEILDAEKAARDAEHDYQVALYKLTKGKQGQSEAQVSQLKSEEAITDSLARQKLLQDEQEERQREVQELTQHDFDRRRDVLESQAAIADTVAERRAIELEILRITYEQKRQALQNIIDTSKNIQEQEDARRDLANLNATYGNNRQAVMRGTRGPLEEWAASVPQTAAQINEAFQSIEANGLESLSNAIAGVIDGTEKLGDAFANVAKSIISDIIKMSVKMLIFRALSAAFGGGILPAPNLGGTAAFDLPSSNALPVLSGAWPSFASGGSFKVLGLTGTDRNLLSLNGLPIANVSHGERISIANDNVNDGGIVVHQTIAPNFAGNAATQEDLVRMSVITKNATIDAIRQERRRSS